MRAVLFLLLCGWFLPLQAAPVTLMAAASLEPVLRRILAPVPGVRTLYAGSGQLARQLERGAPADMVILADPAWMDRLGQRGIIAPGNRHVLACNRLALIAPLFSPRPKAGNGTAPKAGNGTAPKAGEGMPATVQAVSGRLLALADGDRLAIGSADIAPVGAYARAALEALGLADILRPALVPVADARAVVALVARGEAQLGIAYATDAAGDPVRVVALFPPALHPRISYLLGLVRERPESRHLQRLLLGEQTRAILSGAGFIPCRDR